MNGFHRRNFTQLFDLCLILTLEKQFCGNGAGCDGVDRDIAAAQPIGKHFNQPFNSRFRRDIGAISRKSLCDNAA